MVKIRAEEHQHEMSVRILVTYPTTMSSSRQLPSEPPPNGSVLVFLSSKGERGSFHDIIATTDLISDSCVLFHPELCRAPLHRSEPFGGRWEVGQHKNGNIDDGNSDGHSIFDVENLTSCFLTEFPLHSIDDIRSN